MLNPRDMPRLIGLAVILAVAVILAPVPGEAQTGGTARRIGALYSSTRAADTRADESLISGLRALGWIEGRNLVVERRWAEGRADRLQELAHEFAQARVEVIVTAGTTAIRAVSREASWPVAATRLVLGSSRAWRDRVETSRACR